MKLPLKRFMSDDSTGIFSGRPKSTTVPPADPRRYLNRLVSAAAIAIHVSLLVSSLAGLLRGARDISPIADHTIFLALSLLLAICTLVFARWRFAWTFPPAIAILVGLVGVSSSRLFGAQSILITAVLMLVVLLWSGTVRITIAGTCVVLYVLVVTRYGVRTPMAFGQNAGAMIVGVTVAAVIGILDPRPAGPAGIVYGAAHRDSPHRGWYRSVIRARRQMKPW